MATLSLCCLIDKIALMLQEEKNLSFGRISEEGMWSVLCGKSVLMIATEPAAFKLVSLCSS